MSRRTPSSILHTPEPTEEVFVGRAGLRDHLDRLVGAAPLHGGARMLVGEAGIGRSALLRQVARRSTVPVHWGQGTAAEQDVPYAVAADLLAPFGREVAALPTPQREALGAALALASGPAHGPLAVCAGALNTLRAASRSVPLVIVVDDLHRVDEESQQLLMFVARRVSDEHLVMLLAQREDPWADPLEHGVPVVRLTGLTVRECEELARRVGASVTTRQLRVLVRSTGGNPLALRETLTRLPDGEPGRPEDLRVTVGPSVRRAWVPRVEELPSRTRAAMFAIAALGLDGTPSWPSRLAGLGLSVDDLAPAEERRLLRVEASGIVLVHPLLRHVVREATPFALRWGIYQALVREAGADDASAYRSIVPSGEPPAAHAADGSAGALPDRPLPTRVAGLEALTAAEAEVGLLVAAGRSNNEIASSLFVSPKTVEAHLTRVYRKLRIRSRADLTRLVVGTGGVRDVRSQHAGEA